MVVLPHRPNAISNNGENYYPIKCHRTSYRLTPQEKPESMKDVCPQMLGILEGNGSVQTSGFVEMIRCPETC